MTRVVQDDWPELRGGTRLESKTPNLPAAYEAFYAVLFRDERGRILHRYDLPQADEIYYLRSYLPYLHASECDLFSLALKSRLMSCVSHLCRRLLLEANTLRILEVGATVGENYNLLSALLPGADIRFVGVDVDPSLVEIARIAHSGNPRFHMVCADGTDLSRWPDGCFDVVICHGVMNYVQDTRRCLGEMGRVCGGAMVLALGLHDGDASIYGIDAEHHRLTEMPARSAADAIWRSGGFRHDYLAARFPFSSIESAASQYFLNIDLKNSGIFFEYHLISRQELFPQLRTMCRSL
jgi:SAM-dependent methyltransferase